jgi:hypothetical protein
MSSAPVTIAPTPDTVDERLRHIEPLLAWLVQDPLALNWVEEKKQNTDAANGLEKSRWILTNCVLKPFVKAVEAQINKEDPSDSYAYADRMKEIWGSHIAAFDTPNEYGRTATLERLLQATLPFDRANSLYIMKMARDDPKCPSGFVWCNQHGLAAIDPPPAFGETKQCHAVARAYDAVAYNHPNENVRKYVGDMTQTVMPSWLKASEPAYANFKTEKDLEAEMVMKRA